MNGIVKRTTVYLHTLLKVTLLKYTLLFCTRKISSATQALLEISIEYGISVNGIDFMLECGSTPYLRHLWLPLTNYLMECLFIVRCTYIAVLVCGVWVCVRFE